MKTFILLCLILISTSTFSQKNEIELGDFIVKITNAKFIEGYSIATNVSVNENVFKVYKIKLIVKSKKRVKNLM